MWRNGGGRVRRGCVGKINRRLHCSDWFFFWRLANGASFHCNGLILKEVPDRFVFSSQIWSNTRVVVLFIQSYRKVTVRILRLPLLICLLGVGPTMVACGDSEKSSKSDKDDDDDKKKDKDDDDEKDDDDDKKKDKDDDDEKDDDDDKSSKKSAKLSTADLCRQMAKNLGEDPDDDEMEECEAGVDLMKSMSGKAWPEVAACLAKADSERQLDKCGTIIAMEMVDDMPLEMVDEMPLEMGPSDIKGMSGKIHVKWSEKSKRPKRNGKRRWKTGKKNGKRKWKKRT